MAKLIDILARELKVWPDGYARLEQSMMGVVLYRVPDGTLPVGFFTISDNYRTSVVTRAEWQAAVDALNATKVVDGLPAIGSRVFVYDPEGVLRYGQGEDGEVVAHVENTAVIRMSYGLGCFEARCLRTAEQVAAEERDKVIKEIRDDLDVPTAIAERAYKKGYRKQ